MDIPGIDPKILSLLEVAESLYSSGRWNEAVQAYNQVLNINPNMVAIYVQRGLLLCEMGDSERALPDFERALALDPTYGMALYGRGWVKHERDDYQGELEDAQRGLELDPANAAAYYLRMGSAQQGLEQYKQALEAYSQSIALAPNQEGAIYNRGLLYSAMGKYDEALEDFNRALELDPDWTWVFGARGQLYLNKGEYDLARADFIRARDLSPSPEFRREIDDKLATMNTWWRKGLFGILTLQPQAYREVAKDPSETWRAALLVVAVGIIVVILPLLLGLNDADVVRLRDRLLAQRDLSVSDANRLIYLLGALTPLYWVALAGTVATLARLFDSPSRFAELLRTTGYAAIFSIVSIIPLPGADQISRALSVIAYIVAVQAALGSNPRRTVGVGCGGAIIATLLLVVVLVIGLAVLLPR